VNEYLESLVRQPGIEFAMLISHDGVPIAYASGNGEQPHEEGLAALTASWLNDLGFAVAPLGWHVPARAFLRGARGTLVIRRSESVCLVVRLARDTSPENLRLSMDGILARIERARTGRRNAASVQAEPAASEPPGPIPSRSDTQSAERGLHPATQPGTPPGN